MSTTPAPPVFAQMQPYFAAVAEACKEEDGVALTALVSYGCISRKLAYMFARVRCRCVSKGECVCKRERERVTWPN
jgi:hypothetical protein